MLFDICMTFLMAIGYAFLFKERWMSVFPGIGYLAFAILTWTLRCKWQKWTEANSSVTCPFMCYIWTRKIIIWITVIFYLAVISWMMMDIKRAYENREHAPSLGHSELDRLHKKYIGTYWQEIGARYASTTYSILVVIALAYGLMINCALEKAYKVLVELRNQKGHHGKPIDIGDVCVY